MSKKSVSNNSQSIKASASGQGNVYDAPDNKGFRVSVRNLKVHELYEVTAKGIYPTSVIFLLEPLGKFGHPLEIERNLIGEDLNRALRLHKEGSAGVSVNFAVSRNWIVQADVIIDLVLQKFATVPEAL